MLRQEFTITIYTENNIGMLSRVAAIFSRRRINIEGLNIAASEIEGIHRFTVLVSATEEEIRKLSQQIEKQVEVLKCFYYKNEEIVWQEQALYKLDNTTIRQEETEKLLQKFSARQIAYADDYSVFETTGDAETIKALFEELEPLGSTEFVKGARIAIVRSNNAIHQKLKHFEASHRS